MIRFSPQAVVLSAAFVSASAMATDGYLSHGYGTENKGRAGAATAFATDALSVAVNPANIQRAGNRMDVGLAWFSPRREFTVSGAPSGGPGTFPLEPNGDAFGNPGVWESDSNNFFIPHFAYAREIDARSSFGFAIYGNGGMNTDYPAFANPVRGQGPCGPGVFCAGKTGVNLEQLFVVPSYAMKVTPTLTLGIAPIFAYQRFEAKGLAAFSGMSSNPEKLTNKGVDDATGYGARIGLQVEIADFMSFGASYQSKIQMSEFKKYAGLFAEKGDMDIPPTMNVGWAFDLRNGTHVMVDIFHTMYSEVPSVGNSADKLLVEGKPFGSADGPGFGWDDITVVKLGVEHVLNDTLTLRAGYSRGDSPIDSDDVTLNVLAPGVITDHYTVGSSVKLEGEQAVNFSLMYGKSSGEKGPNPFEAPDQQTIGLDMDQYEFEMSYTRHF